jgi:uncharacterized protein YegL
MNEDWNFFEDEKIENKLKTYYCIVVDASGSMSSLKESTLNGINENIQTVKELDKKNKDQDYFVSLYYFNHGITKVLDKVPAKKVEEVTNEDYIISGTTSLHDAIGTALSELRPNINSMDETAVVTIITDGHENSSREYTGKKIKSLVSELDESENWTINLVGANIDTIETGTSLGFNAANVMDFSADADSNLDVYGQLSKSMHARSVSYSTSGSFNKRAYFDKENEEQNSDKE